MDKGKHNRGMIQPTELRIGNYIQLLTMRDGVHIPMGVNFKLVELHAFSFSCVRANNNPAQIEEWLTFSYDFIHPISITEEWLLMGGFIFHDGWYCKDAWSPGHPSQRFDLYWSKQDGFMTKSRYQEDNHDVFKMRHIKYIHQIQNLYLSLTGQELKFNITG